MEHMERIPFLLIYVQRYCYNARVLEISRTLLGFPQMAQVTPSGDYRALETMRPDRWGGSQVTIWVSSGYRCL